jgi:hypothetical protein
MAIAPVVRVGVVAALMHQRAVPQHRAVDTYPSWRQVIRSLGEAHATVRAEPNQPTTSKLVHPASKQAAQETDVLHGLASARAQPGVEAPHRG